MKSNLTIDITKKQLAGLLAGGLVAFTAPAQQEKVLKPSATANSAMPVPGNTVKHGTSRYHPARTPTRAKEYYQSIWGVDNMLVRETASGNLIRFSYSVSDPLRAKALGDDHATPYMFAQRSHALLHIPAMENVGQLRQTGLPKAGQEYWMVFSNKGHPVKVGDRVNVIIGTFHADGLTVE